MTIDSKDVFAKIDTDELIKVALDLGNIDSPTGREASVADYVQDWLCREGFDAQKVGLYQNRPNVIATLPGSGHGRSLCFNSHMDTAVHQEEWWASRHASDRIFHSAWREGDMLVGNGIVNDKGPMATWLLAAKAIKESGAKLKGDLLLMAVVGEIGVEPVDEFQPPDYIAKEAGTRYAITHGGVADFALVAEGTDFGIVGVDEQENLAVRAAAPLVQRPRLAQPAVARFFAVDDDEPLVLDAAKNCAGGVGGARTGRGL